MNISLNPVYIYTCTGNIILMGIRQGYHICYWKYDVLLLQFSRLFDSVSTVKENIMSQSINWVLFNISSIHEIESDIFLLLTGDSQFFNNKNKIRKKKRKHAQGNKNDFFFITWKWIHSCSIEKQGVIIFIYIYSMSTSEQIFCLIPCAILYISYCNFAYNFARTRRSANFNLSNAQKDKHNIK